MIMLILNTRYHSVIDWPHCFRASGEVAHPVGECMKEESFSPLG